jgi:hypothetical protein
MKGLENMKNFAKKIVAIFAILAVAASSFAGCNKKEKDNQATMQYPFEVGSAADNSLSLDNPNADLDAADPVDDATEAPVTEVVTEVQEVTDAEGQPATEFVPVTEADGQEATNAEGAVVTEAVKVTEVVTNVVTKPTEKPTEPAYVPKEDGRYAMWLDISKDENFYFEDEMITASFKIKENIPDGDYKVRIVPDLSDVAGVAIYADKTIDGVIRVNNGEIEAVDVSNETGMVFYGDAISCKQGDTIDFNINIKNNSGLVAFCIWFYFDSNAMEFIEAHPSGRFAEIARDTDIGGGKNKD